MPPAGQHRRRRRLAAVGLIVFLACAFAATVSTRPATAAAKRCGVQAQVSSFLTLKSFEQHMKPARAAYFRKHRHARARRAFVMSQKARLAALRRAAACVSTGNSTADAIEGPPPPACAPTLAALPGEEQNEGILDSRLAIPAKNTLPAVMLFVDFPDLPTRESAANLYERLVPNSRAWFNEISGGRVDLQVTPVLRWYRMPRGSRGYGLSDGVSFEEQRRYIRDAVEAADPDFDFSPFKIVYVVAPRGSALERSPAFHAFAGDGVRADGAELRWGATFGDDVRDSSPSKYPSFVLIHETGHMLGLPDLYDVPNPTYWSLLRFAGGWDIMSWNSPGAHLLAWHKWKLGWLDSSQITCLSTPGEVTATLTPAAEQRGLKAVVVPITSSSALVVEARKRIGEDARLCSEGVLVYTVDAVVRSGHGPVRIRPAERDTSSDLLWRCGPLYAAPFATGRGRVSRFEDASSEISVQVLGSSAAGYRVRVARGTSVRIASVRRAAPPPGDDHGAESAPPVYWGLDGLLTGLF